MKLSGFQKYFLLFILSFGIVQGSYACFSTNNLDASHNHIHFHSNDSKLFQINAFFDLVEETIDDDDDSNDGHFLVDFVLPTDNNFTFQKPQNETSLLQNFLSSQPLHNQKINILNCTFLI